MQISNAAASGHLRALEERLSVRLIELNTRRLWLTVRQRHVPSHDKNVRGAIT
ncbi:LysR family transcriptional regulator [Bradyrhizobium sp. SSUT18]|nr:LysR family transcriptional regulator [Bradyrhizobium sp. SSUT18]MDH2401816.1 LysR family transcriptional regulator [Bradyrhizobium sp. SSUT18]